MKLKKCPMCRLKVPAKSKTCPVCGSEYTKFQYFRMNHLSKCFLGLVAIAVIYNMSVVMMFQDTVREYISNPPKTIDEMNKLKSDYEKLNFIQKHYVHYSDIEIVERVFVNVEKYENVQDMDCEVKVQSGVKMGVYTGRVYDKQPDGEGIFAYYLENGTLCTYAGEFDKGAMTGKGEMLMGDGTKYVGSFKLGLLEGEGIVYNPDGYAVKTGEFVAGKLNGIGTLSNAMGEEIYSGRFSYDIPDKTDYKAACAETTFAQLEADTDGYLNKNIMVSGVITDITVQEDMTVLYIISITGDDNKNICFEYVGEKINNMRQGSRVTFYGYFEGYKHYVGNNSQTKGGMFIKAYYVE